MADKCRVLIVDDDNMLVSMLREGLGASDYFCRTASSGRAAMSLITDEQFDVMVTDIIMPGMDGFALTRAAKLIRPELAIIMMTGFEQDESYDLAITAGASDFIKKPFTIGELAVRIDRVMRDAETISNIRQKQQEVRDISREMIEGVQDEASRKITALEKEILELRKKMI